MSEHSFRIFLSYSHEDEDMARCVHGILKRKGLQPVWDEHIQVGMPFTEEIMGMIARAHVFMPIITETSLERMWVHQETGYAMALNIPVLPISIGVLPEAMPAGLQAINVDDVAELEESLKPEDIDRLVYPPPGPPEEIVSVADWPEERAKRIADYANRVIALKSHGRVRQIGALSSFCMPDVDIKNDAWKLREGRVQRSDYYHFLQRSERQALEEHAREEGCDLIIAPSIEFRKNGPIARKARLDTLLEFLKSTQANAIADKFRVVISRRALEGNLLIVGDWFSAESMAPQSGVGYRHTVFNWHAPTVLRRIRSFDSQFRQLCEVPGAVSGVGPVMEHIRDIIDDKEEVQKRAEEEALRRTAEEEAQNGDAEDTKGS